jgi:Cyclic GMP-AMP synthase DncV-like, nucleotidyltransferase domain
LHRPESTIRVFDPDVRPQGSFRFGTVNRPLNEDDEYDLDNVTVFKLLGKTVMTQKALKELFGGELKAYAKAHNMVSPVVEHNRCWRLHYADEVAFHLDALPCVPEEEALIRRLIAAGVDPYLAECAIAITDRRHPQFAQITRAWYSSNPRGFARWFERKAAMGRPRALREGRLTAAVEDVPPYSWKTPLQQSIQLLKRHRDVMFQENQELAPISMIVTNLSANAYEGETDLATALVTIVEKMPSVVQASPRPRVPNPADPAEDYADKWSKDARLEQNFWRWHMTVAADLSTLQSLLGRPGLEAAVRRMFAVELTGEQVRLLGSSASETAAAVVRSTPTLIIPSAPRPWGRSW